MCEAVTQNDLLLAGYSLGPAQVVGIPGALLALVVGVVNFVRSYFASYSQEVQKAKSEFEAAEKNILAHIRLNKDKMVPSNLEAYRKHEKTQKDFIPLIQKQLQEIDGDYDLDKEINVETVGRLNYYYQTSKATLYGERIQNKIAEEDAEIRRTYEKPLKLAAFFLIAMVPVVGGLLGRYIVDLSATTAEDRLF